MDIGELSREIERAVGNQTPDFYEIYQLLSALDFRGILRLIFSWIFENVTEELILSWHSIRVLAGIILFSVVFHNLADSFKRYNVSDSASIIINFLTFFIVLNNFKLMYALYLQSIENLMRVMKLIIPIYSIAITMTGNLTFASITYEYFFVVVMVLEYVSLHIIGPVICYYMFLELVNHLTGHQTISSLCNSIYFLLSKGNQLLCILLFGFHILEIIFIPAFEQTGHTILGKIISIIPGIGTAITAAGSTALGSAIVLKNALGASSILFLSLMLLLPIVKFAVYIALYVVIAIIFEPICDTNYIENFKVVKKSGLLYMQSLGLSYVLFLVSIALCAVVTNG